MTNTSGPIDEQIRVRAIVDVPVHDGVRVDGFGKRLGNMLGRRVAARPRAPIAGGPYISFTFDDFPLSAYHAGAPALERRGLRGTFYAATGLFGRDTGLWTVAGSDEVRDLVARGHEIGLHTHSHKPVFAISPDDFELDVAENRTILETLVPDLDRSTFAYPFGYVSMPHKRRASRIVRASRAVSLMVNAGMLDRDFIHAVELVDERLSLVDIEALLAQAVESRGWLCFLTHDVTEKPSTFGCSPALLKAAIDLAVNSRAAVLPVRDVLDRIGVP